MASSDQGMLTFTIAVDADTAPSFGMGSVTSRTYVASSPIDEFQVPAASGGNGTIVYTASGLPAGLVFDATGSDTNGCPGTQAREICGTPTTAASAVTVTIAARDSDGNTMNTDRATLTFSVTVAANAVPTFGSGSVSARTFVAGQAIDAFTVPAASGGNGAITYDASNLPDGLRFDATGSDSPGCPGSQARRVCGTPTTAAAAATVTITAQDGDANMAAADRGLLTFSVTVETDAAPSFGMGSVSDAVFAVNTAIAEFTVPAASGGNGTIVYMASGLPTGLVFDATGADTPGCTGTEAREVCGTPTVIGGPTTVTVTARDSDSNLGAGDRATLTFTITVSSDAPPSFGSGAVPEKAFILNTAIADFVVPAASGGNGTITYAASGLPTGLVFDATGTDATGCSGSEAREICGTPSVAGSGTVTITADDADTNMAPGDRATLSFAYSVAADTAPTFGMASVTAKTFPAGAAIAEFAVPAASGGNGTLSYAAANLPSGLVFDATGMDSPRLPGHGSAGGLRNAGRGHLRRGDGDHHGDGPGHEHGPDRPRRADVHGHGHRRRVPRLQPLAPRRGEPARRGARGHADRRDVRQRRLRVELPAGHDADHPRPLHRQRVRRRRGNRRRHADAGHRRRLRRRRRRHADGDRAGRGPLRRRRRRERFAAGDAHRAGRGGLPNEPVPRRRPGRGRRERGNVHAGAGHPPHGLHGRRGHLRRQRQPGRDAGADHADLHARRLERAADRDGHGGAGRRRRGRPRHPAPFHQHGVRRRRLPGDPRRPKRRSGGGRRRRAAAGRRRPDRGARRSHRDRPAGHLDGGRAGATSYKVQWRLAGQEWSSSRQEETTATRLELDGLEPGGYEVRVVAVADGRDGAASAAAAGEVSEPVNAPPRLAEELPALQLDVGETRTVGLDAAFEDPNGDRLRYSASSDGAAVSVRTTASTVRVRGVRPGEATVTVTATDPEGLSATATFDVAVGALLSLSGDAAAPEGGAIVLTATLGRPLAEPLDVSWRVAPDDDPATADADASDYRSAGETTIPAGETAAPIEIAVVDDADIEPARERFVIALDEPQTENVGLSRRARATATIQEGVCDRTPAVRDELARGWRDCRWPRPADLARIPTLRLAARDIDALRPKDLLGLDGLERLDLRANALAALPAGLLSHAPRLERLDLSANALEALPPGLFAGLRRLREVSVADNPGAPFGLAVTLVRTDAAPWAPGPATITARAALGAPFPLAAMLTASPTPAAETALPTAVAVAAGETTGTTFAAPQPDGSPLTLRAAAPETPTAQCNGTPCFRGFETVPGSPLILFHRPPRPLAAPVPEPLAAGDPLRLPLSSLVAPGDAPDGMTWAASSSDDSIATARIVGAALLVQPEPASEGTAWITLVATDALGFATTVRFEVAGRVPLASRPVPRLAQHPRQRDAERGGRARLRRASKPRAPPTARQ